LSEIARACQAVAAANIGIADWDRYHSAEEFSMNSGDSQAPFTITTFSDAASITPDRRSAIAVFEQWQHQWPELFRGAAWLHLERLKKALAEPLANDR
jgi:hypothetical protein